jgi:hypothetical protein
MPSRLINATATFLPYLDDCLPPYIDNLTKCYLDNILIYLINEKEHEDHVGNALQCLQEVGLYCQAEKCQFRVWKGSFL